MVFETPTYLYSNIIIEHNYIKESKPHCDEQMELE